MVENFGSFYDFHRNVIQLNNKNKNKTEMKAQSMVDIPMGSFLLSPSKKVASILIKLFCCMSWN